LGRKINIKILVYPNMSMANGYFGKVLWVDLSDDSFKDQKLSDQAYREYIGGYGLACKLIYESTKAKFDSLGPDSVLGIFPGLLTGTITPFSGRYMVAGKSPLTGTWGDANSGGYFGPEIKRCGYDGILIKGMAEKPKYITIIDDKKQILDASDIWGLDIVETEEKLKEKHGKFVQTASIGQAGEKVSLIAGIANDKGRIAARSGIGAIMGSKKLKSLVLKGKNQISLADKDELVRIVKEYNSKEKAKSGRFWSMIVKMVPGMPKLLRRFHVPYKLATYPGGIIAKMYRALGTCLSNTLSAEVGDSPVKNYGGIGRYDFPPEKSMEISGVKINSRKVRDFGCFSCPTQCGAILEVPELGLKETHLPEYETCCSFGTYLLNNDLISIYYLNDICNRAAIDTISAGVTVGFAIECFENGILTKDDTDGLELTWGNHEAIVKLVEKMISREGFGDVLADGCKKAAEKIGKGSEQYAMHSLGEEIAMHDPKFFDSLGYTYAFDPTPGRHTAASLDFLELGSINRFMKGLKHPEGSKKDVKRRGKGQMMISGFAQFENSLGLCLFTTLFGNYPGQEIIKAVTGWDITPDELIKTGCRIQTLRQAFTLREGVDIASNRIPGRVVGDPPFEKGPNKGVTIDYVDFYKETCEAMGWDRETAKPLKETLQDLNLDFVIKDLY
jgi:aldehyde:ferredoxin oxidoreductase